MGQLQQKGFPLIGAIFLALGVFKFVQGDSWVVWIILGVLFGGLGLFSRRKGKQT
jgi:LPXTG-motif cell wall-anchored protein